MNLNLTIWHHLKDEASANSMCEELLMNNVSNIKVVWAHSLFRLDEKFDYRRLYIDIQTLSEISGEEICQCLLEKWSDAISFIMLESQYRGSWKESFEEKEKIKKSGKYVEVTRNASVSRAVPFSENIVMMANGICPFNGGVLIKAQYNEESYRAIEANLTKLGFSHITTHNIQKNCYKIDFSTNIIKGSALINEGWYCDEFGTWRHSGIAAELVYPNRNKMQRESKWYENEPEWRIVPIKQDTFFDYSGDDSSLNPAFW